METIKTAVVVVLLLAVLYGVYVVLNKPELAPPPEVAWQADTTAPPDVSFGLPSDADVPRALGGSEEPLPLLATEQPLDAPTYGIPPAASSQPSAAPAVGVPSDDQSQLPPYDQPTYDPQAAPSSMASRSSGFTRSDSTVEQAPAEPRPNTEELADEPTAPSSAYLNPEDFESSAPTSTAEAAVVPQSTPGSQPEQPLVGQTSDLAFESAWQSAVGHLDAQRWTDALATLSLFYSKPSLSSEQRQRLLDLLDPLAGKVIYSTEHTLLPAHNVAPGETLGSIADQYQMPVELLQNINRLPSPDALQVGTSLKVVRGPFRAEVNLDKSELVLFLGKMYAGRFSVSVGNYPAPQPAEYEVLTKQAGSEYLAPDGSRVPALAADNPYGRWWIDLGEQMSLHGTPETIPSHGGLGCVSLSQADARDVFGILSVGSRVVFR